MPRGPLSAWGTATSEGNDSDGGSHYALVVSSLRDMQVHGQQHAPDNSTGRQRLPCERPCPPAPVFVMRSSLHSCLVPRLASAVLVGMKAGRKKSRGGMSVGGKRRGAFGGAGNEEEEEEDEEEEGHVGEAWGQAGHVLPGVGSGIGCGDGGDADSDIPPPRAFVDKGKGKAKVEESDGGSGWGGFDAVERARVSESGGGTSALREISEDE